MLNALILSAALAQTGTIEGMVKAEGTLEPIADAMVELVDLERRVVTGGDGRFVLAGVPEGRWTITASALGYRSGRVTLLAAGAGTVRLDFELAVEPIELRPLTVSAERRTLRATGGGADERSLFEREVSPGVVGVAGRELREIPAVAEPDPIRALQALPGVTTRHAYTAELHVNGGAPDQNAFLLDGARVFGPYHFFGIFGALNPDAVGRVELYRGHLPARWGGALSSAVEIEQTVGTRDEIEFAGGLGLLGARLTATGPLPWGDGRFMLAGRRTHADVVAERLMGREFPYAFHDLQARLTLVPAPGHHVRGSLFTSEDRFLMFLGSNADDLHTDWRNRAGSLGWSWSAGGPWSLDATVWASTYGGALAVGNGPTAPRTESRVEAGGVRVEASRRGERTGWRVGLDAEAGRVVLEGAAEPGGFVDGGTRGRYLLPAVYAEAEQWVGPVRLAPGLRIAYDAHGDDAWIQPRLAARYHLAPDLGITLGIGRSYQRLSTLRDDRVTLPGAALWLLHPADAPASRSDGASLSLDGWFDREWSLSAGAYVRSLEDVVRYRPVGDRSLTHLAYDDGRALGLELYARRHEGRVTGWVSYALGRVRLEEEESGRAYAAAWDRRHSLEAALFVRAWRTWSISGRLVYGSGMPFWPFVGRIQMPRFYPLAAPHNPQRKDFVPVWGREQLRFPATFRLDLATRYPFGIGPVTIEPFLSLMNVTRRANVLYYKLHYDHLDPFDDWWEETRAVLLPRSEAQLFGFMPTIGVDVRF